MIHVSAAAIHTVDRTHGLERGADAYLVEPINPDELLATVAAILRYYQARIHAERLAERLAGLARASVAMSAAAGQRELLETAARSAAQVFGSPLVVIATGTDGSRRAALTSGPGEPVTLRSWTVEVGEEPMGVTVSDQSPRNWPSPPWPEGDTVRVLTVRSRLDRPPVHVLVPTTAANEAGAVLTLFGQALLSALDTLRMWNEEHDLALTLQRSLLPRRLPYVAGYDLAVRYVPASERAEIGGDFYEAIRLGDRLLVAVGDVGGHSLHAATVMAELRHATRAYLAEGHGPAAVLDRLNSLMATLLPGEIATICLLAIEVASGRTVLANAGHPPPVHRHCGQVGLVTGRSPLLGIPVRAATEVEFTLAAGDTLVLYTDGLVETRTEPFDESLVRLTRAVREVEPDLETFVSRLVTEVGPAHSADDIALVAVRRHG